MNSVIFCFGDSITHGSSDLELGGWANRLRLYFASEEAEKQNWDVRFYNLGIPGETTEGLIKRFKSETEARLKQGFEVIFIFAFGANDSGFLPEENKFAVEVDKFADNLKTALLEAKEYSSKIILLNITPVIEEITGPMQQRNKKSRFNRYIEPYNQKAKEIADTHASRFVDVNAEFWKQGHTKLLSEDGIHPNAEGHKVISELVLQAIQSFI